MWLPLLGLIIGVAIGLKAPSLPQVYAQYMSVAVLAALDSVFGGVRAGMEKKFDETIFITGFFSNVLLAAGLAYVGERVGVALYTAAIFAFGVRIFQNLAIIRRHILKK
ncbi:MAG: small basic family protein [Eubacteriales bacterium]